MKVLLIHQVWVNPAQAGGTRHYEFAKYLTDQGHAFNVVASSLDYLSGDSQAKGKGWVTKEEVGLIQVFRAWTYPALHRNFFWRVVAFLSFMFTSVLAALKAGRVDVVYGTSPPIFQLASAWFVAKIRRCPLVIEIRDLWPEFAVDMGILKNRFIIWLARCAENFFYWQANVLVVNSPAYREYMIEKGIAPEKIHLIPNGVDPSMFDQNEEGASFRNEFKVQDKYLVVYAGALGAANDIGQLLRAADRLRDETEIHFILAGGGKESDNLKKIAHSLDLPNVTFTGTIPKNRMSEVLAASDVCVATLMDIAMFAKVYPNKVFDYMAAGRPTIMTIDGVIRDVVEKAGGGIYIPPGNDESMADAIRHMHENSEEAAAMGKAARSYVCEHFNREDHAKQLEDLLTQVAKKN